MLRTEEAVVWPGEWSAAGLHHLSSLGWGQYRCEGSCRRRQSTVRSSTSRHDHRRCCRRTTSVQSLRMLLKTRESKENGDIIEAIHLHTHFECRCFLSLLMLSLLLDRTSPWRPHYHCYHYRTDGARFKTSPNKFGQFSLICFSLHCVFGSKRKRWLKDALAPVQSAANRSDMRARWPYPSSGRHRTKSYCPGTNIHLLPWFRRFLCLCTHLIGTVVGQSSRRWELLFTCFFCLSSKVVIAKLRRRWRSLRWSDGVTVATSGGSEYATRTALANDQWEAATAENWNAINLLEFSKKEMSTLQSLALSASVDTTLGKAGGQCLVEFMLVLTEENNRLNN